MSRKLPVLTPDELIKALQKAGFYVVRQSGSHVILFKEGLTRPIPVPRHSTGLKKSLQAKIIKEAGLTINEFIKFI